MLFLFNKTIHPSRSWQISLFLEARYFLPRAGLFADILHIQNKTKFCSVRESETELMVKIYKNI